MSSAAIGQMYRALFTRQFDRRRVWLALIEDLSAEVAGQFDAINIPKDDDDGSWTSGTLANAQGSTLSNHEWPTATIPQATNEVLHIDQVYRINRLIPNVNIVQLRPNQVQSQATFAARRAANLINNYIRGRLNAVTGSGTLLTGISVTASNYANPNAALLTAVRNAFYEAGEELDYAGNPDEARYAVVSPAMYNILIRQREGAALPFAGPLNDQAVALGVIMSLGGFNIIKDPSPGAGKSNTDDSKHTLYFLNAGDLSGVAAGVQLAGAPVIWDGINGSQHDGTYIRGRLLFGAKVHDDGKFRLAKVSIT